MQSVCLLQWKALIILQVVWHQSPHVPPHEVSGILHDLLDGVKH